MGLESLRLVSAGLMRDRDEIWSAAEVLYFDSFKDTAVLEFLYCGVTERRVAEFRRFQKGRNELKDLSRLMLTYYSNGTRVVC